ncbi:Fibronectin type III domain [Popillia japonica]|uniref:Fibronectin type III domain n=1 Tax=Popillia japonica TaxID=7064 RepID=A0AAW1N042_POPJA
MESTCAAFNTHSQVKWIDDLDFAPILDFRWEGIPEQELKLHPPVVVYQPKQDSFRISFSFKGVEIHILLCDREFNKNHGNCYWLGFGVYKGRKNFLRICKEGLIPFKDGSYAKPPCNESKIQINETNIIREDIWNHLSVYKKGNLLEVYLENRPEVWLEYNDTSADRIAVSHVFVRSGTRGSAFMKVHTARVLPLPHAAPTTIALKSSRTSSCIALYLRTCKNCGVNITLALHPNVILQRQNEEVDGWQRIIFRDKENSIGTNSIINITSSGNGTSYISSTIENCEAKLPIVKKAPAIINEQHRAIEVDLDLSFDGKENPQYYTVQYKEENQTNWQNTSKMWYFKAAQQKLTKLKSNVLYQIRVILLTNKDEGYYGNHIPVIDARTTCRADIRDFMEVKAFNISMSITTYPNRSKEICPLTELQLCIYENGNNKNCSQHLHFSTTFSNLEPYHEYLLILYRNGSKIQEWTERTAEGVPEQVQNFQRGKASNTSIELIWDEPQKKNGNIRGYIIKYRHTKWKGCRTLDSKMNTTMLRVLETKVHLNSLLPYSSYVVNIWAFTVYDGLATETLRYTMVWPPKHQLRHLKQQYLQKRNFLVLRL